MEVKRWKKKRIEAKRVKPCTPIRAIHELIDEEQKGKREERTIKEIGSGFPTQLSWTFSHPIQPAGTIW